jgi:hypothetical protein
MYALIPVNISVILQSMRWWIFYIGRLVLCGVYVTPHTYTILLCLWGLLICKIYGLSPHTHTGSPCMHTGISLWHVSNLSASHVLKQNFVHAHAHTHMKNHHHIEEIRSWDVSFDWSGGVQKGILSVTGQNYLTAVRWCTLTPNHQNSAFSSSLTYLDNNRQP